MCKVKFRLVIIVCGKQGRCEVCAAGNQVGSACGTVGKADTEAKSEADDQVDSG